MTPTDATRPADGLAPDAGHTETPGAREGLRGLLGDRYGAFATALLHSAERLAEVAAERDALAASVARVRELHAPRPYADADLRTVSPSLPAEVCGSCWMHSDSAVPYPCPTIRALDGSES